MTHQLHILILEDSPTDFELMLRELRKEGIDFTALRVETESEYRNQLREFAPELILADYLLPSYDGLSALAVARRECPEVPFIFVSGTLGEEAAIEALKQGATDYVLKQRLMRLGSAVRRALREVEEMKKLKEAEESLRDSAALYHSLVENLPQNVFRKDSAGRFTFANQGFCHLLGKPVEEVLGKTDFDFFPRELAEKYRRDDLRTMETGEIFDTVEEHCTPKGKKLYVQVVKSPLYDARGQIIGTQAIFWDVTERKQAEAHIEHLNELLRAVRGINQLIVRERNPQTLMGEACNILVQTRGYRLVWIGVAEPGSKRVVPVARAGYGVDYLDEVTITWDEGITGVGPIGTALRQREPCIVQDTATDPLFAPWRGAAQAGGYNSVAAIPMIQGTHLFGAVSVYADRPAGFDEEEIGLLRELAGDLAFALQSIEDENQRLRAEEKSHAQASLLDLAPDAILTMDMNGRVQYWNKSAERLYGWSAAEAMGTEVSRLFYPGRDEFEAEVRILGIKGEGTAELRHFTKNDGRVLVRSRWHLVRDADGRPQSVLIINSDITKQKQLEDQFRQAQKMEAIGRLAGGIAHDFNNLLTVILGYGDMLLSDLTPNDAKRGDIEQIKKSAARAASLTAQLLAFSRSQVLQPRVLDLNDLIADMEIMLRRMIGEDIDLIIVSQAGMGFVKADPGQIQQVVMNLAINARDAMEQGGRLTIETATVDFDESYVQMHVGAQVGPYVMLAVSDNGCGMDAATQARVFEPFFTTKEQGKGTGLGLSTAYGIVKQSDGFICVYSEPGKGSTFKVYLPRVAQKPNVPEKKPKAELDLRGAETVLFVEDDSTVRELASRVLQRQGYTVLEASNGAEAMNIAREFAGEIHLVLTDLVMPQMGGTVLASQIETVRPGIKLLFTSGYTNNAIVHHGMLETDVLFLQKPFTAEGLAGKVHEVLRSEQTSNHSRIGTGW